MVVIRRKRVAREWDTYAERVLPTHADAIQVQETRRAFYAGVQAFLNIVFRLDPGEEPTANDLRAMEEVEQELRDFVRDVQAGRR